MAMVKIDTSGNLRYLYTKVCACGCEETYQTTSKHSKCMKGHGARLRKGEVKAQARPHSPTINKVTLQEALREVPASCTKCGNRILDILFEQTGTIRPDDGFGVFWRCVICGMVKYPVRGLELKKNTQKANR